ncbi:MAG: low molecular weight protein-tyrosine-phosphatase [Thermostichales cyanobacterium BF4_bins_65]
MTTRLLFVCLGNICRSPAAENIMRHLVSQAGLAQQILCDSAGTSNYHPGEPPDRRMQKVLASYGIPVQGRARQIRAADLAQFDLILAMDRDNFEDICALDPKGLYHSKVHLMGKYCRDPRWHNRDVPDPYYGGEAIFHEVVKMLWDGCENLLAELRQTLES